MFEVWDDEASLEAHVASDHEQAWRRARIELGAGEHSLMRYGVSSAAPIG